MTLEHESIKQQLRSYICRALMNRPDYPLRDDQSLINGGFLDSFAVVDLLIFVEDSFGIHIPNEEIDVDKMDTVDLLAAFVMEWRDEAIG